MSQTVVSKVVVEMAANVARLQKDFEDAKHIVEHGTEQIAHAWETVKGAIESAIAFVGFEKMVERFMSAAEALDQLGKNAQKLGIGVETMQELSFAFETAGVKGDQFTKALAHLAKYVEDATAGNKDAIFTFKQLGITMDDLKNKSLDQIFRQLTETFASHADGVNKTAATYKLFGREGKELIPVMDKGTEGLDAMAKKAHDLAIVMSQENIKAAEKLNESLSTLNKIISAQLLKPYIDAIGEAAENTIDFAAHGLPVLTAAVIALKYHFDSYESTLESVNAINADLLETQRRYNELTRNGTFGIQTLGAQVLERQIGALNKALDGALAKLREYQKQKAESETGGHAATGGATGGIQTPKPPLPNVTRNAEGEAYIETLKEQVRRIQESEFAMMRLRAQQKGVAQDAEPYIKILEDAHDSALRLGDAIKAAARGEDLQKQIDDANIAMNKLAIQTQFDADQVGKLADETQRAALVTQLATIKQTALAGLWGEQYDIANEQLTKWEAHILSVYDKALQKSREFSTGWHQSMKQFVDDANNGAKTAQDFFTNFTQSAEDNWISFLKGGTDAFKNFVDSVLEQMLRVQFRRWLAGQMEGSGGDTGFFGLLGAGINALFGGSTTDASEGGYNLFQGGAGSYNNIGGGALVNRESTGQRFVAVEYNGPINVGNGVSRAEMASALDEHRMMTLASVQDMLNRGAMVAR